MQCVFAMFFTPGPMEMCIFGLIALLLFGNRLPKVARSIGSSLNEFRKGTRDITDEFDDVKATAKDAQNDVNKSIADLTK